MTHGSPSLLLLCHPTAFFTAAWSPASQPALLCSRSTQADNNLHAHPGATLRARNEATKGHSLLHSKYPSASIASAKHIAPSENPPQVVAASPITPCPCPFLARAIQRGPLAFDVSCPFESHCGFLHRKAVDMRRVLGLSAGSILAIGACMAVMVLDRAARVTLEVISPSHL